ncbi:MAG: 5-(carboxyamino)imidazole ribonucleotide mutase [Clostridia bacterium]|nr:5-(carboxyamino)imidazole ribonucleotide mutase [Clostridia bacterium]MCI9275820.1 5-(carboxyamino)imidazole ribonucleotide mutase [Clostridia bacterium]
MEKQIDVAIIMGSDSDLPIMKDAAKFLDEMGVSYEITVLSVHRCPEAAMNYAKSLKERKVKVIIAGAGGAAHLPGVFAAQVPCPVIGVPIMSKTLNGVDALYSIVQMPSGIPVATVAINGAKNAGILATTILSTSNDELYKKICDYKAQMNEAVLAKNEKLQKLGYEEYINQMK